MLEKLQILLTMPFAQTAMLAIVPLSLLCAITGSLIIANRLSYVAGGLTHGAYGGIGIGVYCSLPILPSTLAFVCLLSLLMAYLIQKYPHASDNFIGAIWAFGMALGILLLDFSPHYKADMMGYLFGNILVLSHFDLTLMLILSLLFALILFVFYPQIQALSFDREFAQILSVPCTAIFYGLILMIGLCVAISMQAVGLILVIALLSIPTFIAQQLSCSLKGMIFYAFMCNLLFCFLGILASFIFDTSSGASIIMVSVLGFVAFLACRKLLSILA